MAMMTWMRRVAPYLLAAVLIAFIVSLAYFGTQRDSGGGGGGGAAVVTVEGDAVTAVTFDRAYRAAVGNGRWRASAGRRSCPGYCASASRWSSA
jgi:hypothetical protein